ncbi:Gfo/Idh/MocA family protein [Microbacterium sp. I2]|uniref:Gfo/Idh/MocA family protein n=1 Tax=Microbacterium sp. I2 TaxID=3391826 RepID=UPI003ED8D9AE
MSEASRPLGIGIVGVGGIAVSHMAALRAMPEARLVAVCDVDAARAAEAAHVERCTPYDDVEVLLADPSVDAVIVCTPNMTHESLGRTVLAAGKHLLMEKPLAMTSAGARALQREAAERGLALAVGHSHRFSDQGLAIRDAIDAGVIGTPRFVRVAMNGGWIWPGWQSWVLNPELSGGHSLHNGVHLVDLASWWIGEPAVSVFAAGQKATSAALGIHDYLVMELGFASGAAAVCEISRGERPRSASYLELTVVGTEGVLAREWDAEGLLAWTDTGLAAWGVDGAGARTFRRELEGFVDAARGRRPVVPPVAAAVHAVDLAVASERSLATGDTVRIEEAA